MTPRTSPRTRETRSDRKRVSRCPVNTPPGSHFISLTAFRCYRLNVACFAQAACEDNSQLGISWTAIIHVEPSAENGMTERQAFLKTFPNIMRERLVFCRYPVGNAGLRSY